MTIRQATQQDIPRLGELLVQICNVHHDGRPDLFQKDGRKYNDSELSDLLQNPDHPIFVACDENQTVLGYAFCILQSSSGGALVERKTLYLDDLCVDKAYRSMNIGTALFDHIKAYAASVGCYNLTLNVWSCNQSALRFYEKHACKPQKIGMEIIL